jgi:Ca2+-binding EF-hand superfamily protein
MKPFLAIATVALLSSAAFAQTEGRPSMSAAFDALDANKDSRINREESQSSPVVAQSFAQADADADGAITREEFMSSFTMGGGESAPPAGAPREPSGTSPPR